MALNFASIAKFRGQRDWPTEQRKLCTKQKTRRMFQIAQENN